MIRYKENYPSKQSFKPLAYDVVKTLDPNQKLAYLSVYMNDFIDGKVRKGEDFRIWILRRVQTTIWEAKVKSINNAHYDCKCAYCETPLNEKTRTRDHIIPLRNNGSSVKNNIAFCCTTCNEWKGCTLPHDWLRELKFTTSKRIGKGTRARNYDRETIVKMIINLREILKLKR